MAARRPRLPGRPLLVVVALGLGSQFHAFFNSFLGSHPRRLGVASGRGAGALEDRRRDGPNRRPLGVAMRGKGFASSSGLKPLIKKSRKLPPYLDLYITKNKTRLKILLKKCREVGMPMSKRERRDLSILEEKFDQETSCLGLAAPQIGIDRRMIAFKVLDAPDMAGRNITQEMDRTIWINPSYSPLTDEIMEDYEACFSLNRTTVFGKTPRPRKIAYKATLPNGNIVEGEAVDFLARVIMHEVDHLDGILFIDKAYKDTIFCSKLYDDVNTERLRMLARHCAKYGINF